jgi:hypothetical protein
MPCPAVNKARNRLLEAGLANPACFVGCTETEIKSLEDRFSVRLPKCYRGFLKAMGRAAGEFLGGSDYCWGELPGFRKAAEDLLRGLSAGVKLSDKHFVFLFHQGYTFLFFDCHESPDDPPVHMFTETGREPVRISDTFSDWLMMAVEDDIAATRDLR